MMNMHDFTQSTILKHAFQQLCEHIFLSKLTYSCCFAPFPFERHANLQRAKQLEEIKVVENKISKMTSLVNFFTIFVVFWEECCGGPNSLGKTLKLWILTSNRPGYIASVRVSEFFTKF